MKKIVPFSFYLLYFGAFAFMAPYLVLFYQSLGFNGTQIGLLTGIPPLITLVGAPLGAGLADRWGIHKWVMALGLGIPLVIALLLPSVSNFVLTFALIILFNIFMSPVSSLSDSATIAMLGDEKEMYGRVRLGGTVGWGIFVQISGILLRAQGLEILFYVCAGLMLVNLFVSQRLSFIKHEDHKAANGGATLLLRNRRWMFFLAHAFLAGVGAFSVASYFSAYLQELGADGNLIGFALMLASVVEAPIFFFGNFLVKRFSAYGLFVFALMTLGIRSVFFGVVDNLFLATVVMALGGATFPLMWSGGVAYADENAPVGLKSTAQGLFSAFTFGFGSAFSGFVGGLLLESVGGRGMFLVFGIVILAGLGLIEGVKRLFPEKELVQAES